MKWQVECFIDGKSEGRVGDRTYATREEAERVAKRWIRAHRGLYDYRAMPVPTED